MEHIRVFGTVRVKDSDGVVKWERTGEGLSIKVAGDRIIIEYESGRKIDRYIPSLLESVEVTEF